MDEKLLYYIIGIVILLIFFPTIVDIIIYFKINRFSKDVVRYRVSILERFIKLTNPITTLFFSFCIVLLVLLWFVIGYQKSLLLEPKLMIVSGLLLGVLVFIAFVVKLAFNALTLYSQYSRNEADRRIECDKKNKMLIIENTKLQRKQIIPFSQIALAEVHRFDGNSRSPLAGYEYLRLVLADQEEIIISSLIANSSSLALLLQSKKMDILFNSYNPLPCIADIPYTGRASGH